MAKTLGARPRLLRSAFFCEFALLGVFAGVAGALLGTALASILLTAVFHQTTVAFQLLPLILVVAISALSAAAAGSLLGESMLRRKTMAILRDPG